MADDRDDQVTRALAKLDGESWRGDEHGLRLQAAREAGLAEQDIDEVELQLYTEGFKAGMTLDDPADHTIVLRGRTVLSDKQLSKVLRPTLRFLKLRPDQVALRVHDGEFELRVEPNAAEQATPAIDSAKQVLRLWLGFGAMGAFAWFWFELAWLAGLIWGGALIGGGYALRQGAVSGRALLGARLTVALAMLAQQEQLILPPARRETA